MKISLSSFDETTMHVDCEPAVSQELYDMLSFDVPNAKFMPTFRNKIWDGKIHLFDKRRNSVHKGLAHYIKSYCDKSGYVFSSNFSNESHPESDYKEFISTTEWYASGKLITPREYQLDAIKRGITNNRLIIVSPTGSGKSLIIASLIKFYYEKVEGKILLICPTTSLVEQMYSDMQDYFPYWDIASKTTRIYSGMERSDSERIVISTWQSLYDYPTDYFNRFDVVIGDEAHLYKAKETSKLFNKCTKSRYRYGFTGTLSGENMHQLQLEGIFGKAHQLTTTNKLIKEKQLSPFKINVLVLSYSEKSRKETRGNSWEEEVQFIISNDKRNKYISNLAASLKGNTLVLFSRVETHGKLIFDLLKEKTDKPVYFIYGGTETEIREEIRKSVDSMENAVLIASSQIFSTGINIPSLKNIIFTHPSKSRIRTLQSIGRVLRLSKNKSGESILYDIVDDLRTKKNNYAYNHFTERIKIYAAEDFNYRIIEVGLEK